MIIEAREDVVRLEGALDKNLWPTIQAAANLLLRHHMEGIIVDGGGLTGCSPEGAKTFRDAMDYIERYRARIVVCDLPDSVMEVVKAVPGVRSRLPIADTLEEARASLRLAGLGPSRAVAGSRLPLEILVPLLSGENPAAATGLACRLASAEGATRKARLHLAYMLEIPRHLPLTAPLPEEESAAGQALETAVKSVRCVGVAAEPRVIRTRDLGEEIVAQAAALSASLIVLGYQPAEDPAETRLAKVVRLVLDRAPCEVILNKQPRV